MPPTGHQNCLDKSLPYITNDKQCFPFSLDHPFHRLYFYGLPSFLQENLDPRFSTILQESPPINKTGKGSHCEILKKTQKTI